MHREDEVGLCQSQQFAELPIRGSEEVEAKPKEEGPQLISHQLRFFLCDLSETLGRQFRRLVTPTVLSVHEEPDFIHLTTIQCSKYVEDTAE